MSDQTSQPATVSQLQVNPCRRSTQQLGTSTEQASSAVSQALPL